MYIEFCQMMLYVDWGDHVIVLSFLLKWKITFINLRHYVAGKNASWPWYIIIFIYHRIWFAKFCLGFLHISLQERYHFVEKIFLIAPRLVVLALNIDLSKAILIVGQVVVPHLKDFQKYMDINQFHSHQAKPTECYKIY